MVLGILLGSMESVARLKPIEARLATPGIGTTNPTIDGKLQLLDALVASEGRIDCIIVGSSMVTWGIDPTLVGNAYRDRTGRESLCFNYGVNGFTSSEVGIWAEVLANRYHPSVMIFAQSARDYSGASGGENLGFSLDVPWVRYQLGQFAPEGWLIEHSRAYQYYMAYRYWPVPNFYNRLLAQQAYEDSLTPLGYRPESTIRDVSIPPEPGAPENQLVSAGLAAYDINAEDLAGLERFLALKDNGLQVALIEMPLPETYYVFFGNDTNDYQRFLNTVGRFADSTGTPFVRTTTMAPIPGDCCWSDYGHLSKEGAVLFSEWLGDQLADLAAQGDLQFHSG